MGPCEILFEKIHERYCEAAICLESFLFKTPLGQFWGFSGSWIHLFSPESQFLTRYFAVTWSFSKNWQAYGEVNNSLSKICLCLQTTEVKKVPQFYCESSNNIKYTKPKFDLENMQKILVFKSLCEFPYHKMFSILLEVKQFRAQLQTTVSYITEFKKGRRFLEKCGLCQNAVHRKWLFIHYFQLMER